MKLNQNYANLQESYLFLTIAKKVAAYTEAHPDNHIIRMGIGDVTQPLVPAVIEAMHGWAPGQHAGRGWEPLQLAAVADAVFAEDGLAGVELTFSTQALYRGQE